MKVEKVLLVDDDPDIRKVGRLSLERVGGLQVVDASSGEEALVKAASESPDLVLLDVMMPGMDGPQVLRRLRDDPATASLPVIFLTAKVMTAEVKKLKASGALDVIAKPFDPMQLAAQIKQIVSRALG